MIVEVFSFLFGSKFVGLPVFKLASGVSCLGKYAIGGLAVYSASKVPSMINRQSFERSRMLRAFQAGEIFNTKKLRDFSDGQIKVVREYPKIERVRRSSSSLSISFRLPPGFSPQLLHEKVFVFQQIFGQNARLLQQGQVHELEVLSPLPSSVPYSYLNMETAFNRIGGLPVVIGIDQNGKMIGYDMKQKPHLGIVGVTGFGKSSFLRALICSWLQYFSPEQLQLYLGDLKKTEFQQYQGVDHVKRISVSHADVTSLLRDVVLLLDERSTMLGKARASNIDQYRKKTGISLPYVVVFIDEVALLSKERKAHEYLDEIGAIGRALGVFLVLSQQRADAEIISGRLKNNLTVRVAYRMSDELNSRMFLDSNVAANLHVPGRCIVKEPTRTCEVQTPWLSEEEAESIIERYFGGEHSLAFGESFDDVIFGEVASTCEIVTNRY